ncbi:hypothetical protein [Aureibacillus halotolerans]|uniref:Uncharacterized protein n=1 Tax=Aureibacillus halotolerans TaxID=1508390 RepID=A0A4R6U2P4_9BACI|nr:hypothetical protein [Aureibacillus halotolerans]TDQ38709.1 hypothetical protein EV213_10978 [Aureibacillus halotolerans]
MEEYKEERYRKLKTHVEQIINRPLSVQERQLLETLSTRTLHQEGMFTALLQLIDDIAGKNQDNPVPRRKK